MVSSESFWIFLIDLCALCELCGEILLWGRYDQVNFPQALPW